MDEAGAGRHCVGPSVGWDGLGLGGLGRREGKRCGVARDAKATRRGDEEAVAWEKKPVLLPISEQERTCLTF